MTCFEILKVEEGLWARKWVKGIEPTNNAVERALRHAVLWRRISGGTDSERGSRFVERMLTVVATCRQQGRNVLREYLTSCFEADCRGQALPQLCCRSPRRRSKPPDGSSRMVGLRDARTIREVDRAATGAPCSRH
ncbi:MAG: transposase [Isosphaeraceae bacterium]